MIIVRCPYCHEERLEDELRYGGEAGVIRPADPASATDAEWSEYLYLRDNVKGWNREQWCCADGCGQWFHVVRNTATHEIDSTERISGGVSGKWDNGS